MDLLLKKEKLIFFEELEMIKELEYLETNSSRITVRSPLAVSKIVLVLKLNFSLEYLLEYLENFPLNLSFFQLMG